MQGLLVVMVAMVNISNQAKEQEAAPPALLLRKPRHSYRAQRPERIWPLLFSKYLKEHFR